MIDPKIQEELRAKYNPDGSLLRQHQLRMVEMLKYFDELCQKHDIKYWLSSGNCIGVARHGGFIPWDDDIDVEMLREDYLKLEKVFKETDDYVLQTWRNDLGYFKPYAKMRDKHSFVDEDSVDALYSYRGVFIDVFFLEKSNKLVHRYCSSFMTKVLSRFRTKSYFKYVKLLVFLLPYFFRFLSFISFNKELRHTYGLGWSLNIRDEKDIFPLQRAFFEGIQVNVPSNLDGYLTKIYGDYMCIPAEEKIVRPHAVNVRL